ncbi:MAG: hypothetical protein U0232_07935 [Thermomicrobiales bacterium]
MQIWIPALPDVGLVQWFHRIPTNTTYWTGFPDEKNPYINSWPGTARRRSGSTRLNRRSRRKQQGAGRLLSPGPSLRDAVGRMPLDGRR